MKNNSTIKKRGVVTEALPNTMFRVKFEESGEEVLVTLKGILRRRYVRIFPGDKVVVEMTKYDEKRGRIIQKLGKRNQ